MGLALAPIRDGEVLSPQDFEQLPQEEKERRQQALEQMQKEVGEFLHQLPRWEKEQREQLRELNREITLYAVGHPIDEVKKRWSDVPAVLEHLEAMRQDVIENVDDFLPKEQQGPQIVIGPQGRVPGAAEQLFRRYQVNCWSITASRAMARNRAPIVYEDHPTLSNLVGRIEHLAQFGTLVTDFILIKPGALHRANAA
jgi:predicted ATP-dependent protease